MIAVLIIISIIIILVLFFKQIGKYVNTKGILENVIENKNNMRDIRTFEWLKFNPALYM